MGYLDYLNRNPDIARQQVERDDLNSQVYRRMAGLAIDEASFTQESYNEFKQDMRAYEMNQDTTPYQTMRKHADNKFAEEISAATKSADDWRASFYADTDANTPEQAELYEKYGFKLRPYLDFETGTLTGADLVAQQGRDFVAYGIDNMNALSSVEQASMFNVGLMYSGNNTIFDPLAAERPDLFKIQDDKKAYLDEIMKYTGAYSKYASGEFELFENIVSWWGNVLPTDVLGGMEQEGWDAKEAWEVFQKYHPGFSSYLKYDVGINEELLLATPNHWEFRFMINNAVQMAAISESLAIADMENNMFEDSLVWTYNFAKQSFRSSDMPLEIALTVATFGGYAAIGAGLHTVKGVNMLRRIGKGADLAGATGVGIKSWRATSWLADKHRKVMAAALPSNWGHMAVARFTKKDWLQGNYLSKVGMVNAGKMAVVDAGQGTVEGFLYGLQNQLTDNKEGVDAGRIWTETWSEALGQMAFGKVFRGVNKGAHFAGSWTFGSGRGSRLWAKASSRMSPQVKAYIETTVSLKNVHLMSEDQIQLAYMQALSLAQMNISFGTLVGNERTSIPPYILDLTQKLNIEAKKQGVTLSPLHVFEGLVARQQETRSTKTDTEAEDSTHLTETDAQLLIYTALMDSLSANNVNLTEEAQAQIQREFLFNHLTNTKLREQGITPENVTEEEYQKAWNEVVEGIDEQALEIANSDLETAMEHLRDRHLYNDSNKTNETNVTPNESANAMADIISDDNNEVAPDIVSVVANIDLAGFNFDRRTAIAFTNALGGRRRRQIDTEVKQHMSPKREGKPMSYEKFRRSRRTDRSRQAYAEYTKSFEDDVVVSEEQVKQEANNAEQAGSAPQPTQSPTGIETQAEPAVETQAEPAEERKSMFQTDVSDSRVLEMIEEANPYAMSLVENILHIFKRAKVITEMKAIRGLKLLSETWNSDNGLKNFNDWWAGVLVDDADGQAFMWQPEVPHRNLLAAMREAKKRGLKFENRIALGMKELDIVKESPEVFKEVLEYEAPARVEQVIADTGLTSADAEVASVQEETNTLTDEINKGLVDQGFLDRWMDQQRRDAENGTLKDENGDPITPDCLDGLG